MQMDGRTDTVKAVDTFLQHLLSKAPQIVEVNFAGLKEERILRTSVVYLCAKVQVLCKVRVS
jgi:hypothetical protein